MEQEEIHYVGTYDTEYEIKKLMQHMKKKNHERFIVFSMPSKDYEIPEADNTEDFSQILLKIGIHPNLLGYKYILYAIHLILKDSSYLKFITKRLYIDIAMHYHTTAARVERAMRHAISSGWPNGNPEFIQKFYTDNNQRNKKVPSNSQFLSALYFYSRQKQLEL